MLRIDARIPVRFGAASGAGPEEAVLVEGTVPAGGTGLGFAPGGTGHVPGCACCVARSPAAVALAALFQMRARGETVFFRAVVAEAGPAGQAEIRASVEADPVVSARFRIVPA